jgi:hypothetical protein
MVRFIKRMICRFNEEAAAVHGQYGEAHYWLRKGDSYRKKSRSYYG